MSEISEPSKDSTDAPLLERIAALEAEVARLRQIEAAAREARAFMEGRRPGFAPSYPLDVLRTALNNVAPELRDLPVVRAWNARRKPGPKKNR